MFRYHDRIFNTDHKKEVSLLEREMQKQARHSEQEKVEFILQKWQRYMLVAHKYQLEKLIG